MKKHGYLVLGLAAILACGCGPEKPADQGGDEPGPTPGPVVETKEFTSLHFESAQVAYDGEFHTLQVTGDAEELEGATIMYDDPNGIAVGQGYIEPGSYKITVTVSKTDYNSFVKEATLTIGEKAPIPAIIKFEDVTVVYDGAAHEVAVAGAPEGAEIVYAGERSHTDVGEYPVHATVSVKGYEDWEGDAVLKITKAAMPSIAFASQYVEYDGESHTIAPTGQPKGASVEYVGEHEFSEEGVHEVTVKVSHPNYEPVQKTAKLVIYSESTEELLVDNFNGIGNSDLAENWKLEKYDNGWKNPTVDTISVEKESINGVVSDAMKFNIHHNGSAYKATHQMDFEGALKSYSGIKVSARNASTRSEAVKFQVQVWYKDLPLEGEYAGYSDGYITYTVNELSSNWNQFEIRFDDAKWKFNGIDLSVMTFAQAMQLVGLTPEIFSLYIDKVAILMTASVSADYGNGYAYVDDISLANVAASSAKEVVKFAGKQYTTESSNGTILKLTIVDLNAVRFETLNLEENLVVEGTATVEGNSLVIKNAGETFTCSFVASSNGAVIEPVSSRVPQDIGMKYGEDLDFNCMYEVKVVDDFESYAATGQGYDRGHRDPTLVSGLRAAYYGEVYNDQKPASGPIDANWSLINDGSWTNYIQLSNAGRSGNAMGLTNNNDWQTRYMSFGLMNGKSAPLGMAKTFSFYVKGSVAQTIKAKVYYDRQITTTNQGDGVNSVGVANVAVGTEWTRVDISLSENRMVYGFEIIPTKKNGTIYIDDVRMFNVDPDVTYVAPVEHEEITDGKFGLVAGGAAYVIDIANSVTTAQMGVAGGELTAFTAEQAEGVVTLKDSASAGAGLTITANIVEGKLVIATVTGAASSSYNALVGASFVKFNNVNMDFQGAEYVVNSEIPYTNWTKKKYTASGWVDGGKMYSKKSNGTNKFINMYSSYSTPYTYEYSAPEAIGPVNHVSFKYSNDFGGAIISVKMVLKDINGTEHYIIGDASNFLDVPAGTGNRMADAMVEFSTDIPLMNVQSVKFAVRSAKSGDDYFYIDDLFIGYKKAEEPAPEEKTISDGRFYLWNSASDAFIMDISSSVKEASLKKIGGEDSYPATVTMADSKLTIAVPSALTIEADILEGEQFKVTSVTGAASSLFSASLLNKTFKKTEAVNVDFSDGTVGSPYKNSKWTAQKYTTTWVDANTDMNCRNDINSNKVVNIAINNTLYNYFYTPSNPMGPVNHFSIDLGNYYSSAKDISYKIAIIDGGGQKTYIAGSESEFATLEYAGSTNAVLNTIEKDFSLCVGYKIQITVQASAQTYFYMDNIKVTLK